MDDAGAPAASRPKRCIVSDGPEIAQARRDRARLAAAAAEIAWLRERAGVLERGLARRVMRRLGVLPVIEPHAAPSPQDGRGLALVIDNQWPQPDRDAGSIEIVNLVQALGRLGFTVLLAAAKEHAGKQPARDRLEGQGIRCLGPDDAVSVERWLDVHGHRLDLCVLCRAFCGGAFLEQAQRVGLKARLLFNSIDLSWLREMRRAETTGDAELAAMGEMLRSREQHVIRSCDATIVVSEVEAALLAADLPESRVAVLPLARAITPPQAGFAERDGIGFIGNFGHAPNGDAVRWFLDEVWPLVRRDLPAARLSIAGPDAPPEFASMGEGVEVVGHVPDLVPWFEQLRATVAPLRYGAGAKGKVASSLAMGVPCAATPVATEGMAIGEGDGVLVAADPPGLAAALIRLHTDAALWQAASTAAIAYAERMLSLPAWERQLEQLLNVIGL